MPHHRPGLERFARELARQAEQRELDVDNAILAMADQDEEDTAEFLRSLRNFALEALDVEEKGSA